MKFDVAIMNPPYDTNENPIGQNCYNIACKYVNHVICIMPVRPLQDPVYRCKRHSFYTETVELTIKNTQRMLKIFKAIESDKCFGIASGKDLGIYEHNTKVAGNIDRDDIIIDRIGKIAYSIIKTVIDTNLPSLRKQRREGEKTKYNVWIPRVSGGAEKNGTLLSNAAAVLTGTAVLDKKEYISFKTYDEAQNFIESSRTKFMRYIIKHAATQRDVPLSFIPFMNDYKEPWTNERFYKYFNLTPEEIEEVENEV